MRKKILFDDEWKAKRVFTERNNKAKSSYAYKNTLGNYKNSIRKSSGFGSNISSKKTITKQSEVVVKITGASRNFEALKAHLRYISRKGKLELETSTSNKYQGKESLSALADDFNVGSEIPTEDYIRDNSFKEQREALHFVFSMRDIEYANPRQIKESAMQTISELYPNNFYAIAYHGDTDNPHCHLILKVEDINGKRINPKKKDLALIRSKFAENLRERGVEAKATISKKEMGDKEVYVQGDFKKPEHKPHHYEVVNFGAAHFKFNPENRMSYFVRYRTSKGKDIDIWADDLERVIRDQKIQTGEYCRFAITAEEPKTIKIQDKKSKKWYEKTVYKKTWDVSIEKRAEKTLNPLKKFTPNQYREVEEPYNKIIDFGMAHYQFSEDKPMSFFVKLQNHRGKEFTIWGKELEKVIEENKLKAGDECIFEKTTSSVKTENNTFIASHWQIRIKGKPNFNAKSKQEQKTEQKTASVPVAKDIKSQKEID